MPSPAQPSQWPPRAAQSSTAQQIHTRAAVFSHLQLAIANLGAHNEILVADDRAALDTLARNLQAMALGSPEAASQLYKLTHEQDPAVQISARVVPSEALPLRPHDTDMKGSHFNFCSGVNDMLALPMQVSQSPQSTMIQEVPPLCPIVEGSLESGKQCIQLPPDDECSSTNSVPEDLRDLVEAYVARKANNKEDPARRPSAFRSKSFFFQHPETLRLSSVAMKQTDNEGAEMEHHQVQPWQEHLMEMFGEIDEDGNGCIDNTELRHALAAVGVTPARSMKMLQLIDANEDGVITKDEWDAVVIRLGKSDPPLLIKDFMKALVTQAQAHGRLYAQSVNTRRCFFLHYDCKRRTAWDLIMVFFLFYIALALPFSMGFTSMMDKDTVYTMSNIDLSLDCFFMLDMVLNFRTSYVRADGRHVTSSKGVAKHYLRTWFFLDLISSVPVERVFHMMPDMQAGKLLKFGKIAKALKMLRIGRVIRRIDFGDYFDELASSSAMMMKLASLGVVTACVCHWLACFCVFFGGKMFHVYKDVGASLPTMYLAAMYWAMTTITTVGFGDITPETDGERIYCILAMVVGGSFYGYVIGMFASLVSTKDANLRNYNERIALVQAWLDYHSELPRKLVRRVRRHYKTLLTDRTAMDDSEILEELSPELRLEVSKTIVNDDVRYNLLFEDLPSTALALLIPILQTTSVEAHELVVGENEPGVAMFIIVSGHANISVLGDAAVKRSLGPGDSWGEEVVLGLEQRYDYTVTATSKMTLHMIPEKAFFDCFMTWPDMVENMRANYLKRRKDLSATSVNNFNDQKHVRKSIYPDNTQSVSHLKDIQDHLDELQSGVDTILEWTTQGHEDL